MAVFINRTKQLSNFETNFGIETKNNIMKLVIFEVSEKKTEVRIDGLCYDITNTAVENKFVKTLKELQIHQKQHQAIDGISIISFVEAIKQIDPGAFQPWLDKRGWLVSGPAKYNLMVWIYDDRATVSPRGYGAGQPLIAKTPEQLKQCCEIWWLNR